MICLASGVFNGSKNIVSFKEGIIFEDFLEGRFRAK